MTSTGKDIANAPEVQILLDRIESLQRENEELRRDLSREASHRQKLQNALAYWMPGVTEEIEIGTNGRCGDDALLLVGSEGPFEDKCWGNEILARAEAAEAEVKRLQAEIDRKSSMPGDHRYWEGRYRDEAADNDRLRGILFKCGSFIADRYQEGDAEYQVVLLVNDAICSKPALASTGGEHHAE